MFHFVFFLTKTLVSTLITVIYDYCLISSEPNEFSLEHMSRTDNQKRKWMEILFVCFFLFFLLFLGSQLQLIHSSTTCAACGLRRTLWIDRSSGKRSRVHSCFATWGTCNSSASPTSASAFFSAWNRTFFHPHMIGAHETINDWRRGRKLISADFLPPPHEAERFFSLLITPDRWK